MVYPFFNPGLDMANIFFRLTLNLLVASVKNVVRD